MSILHRFTTLTVASAIALGLGSGAAYAASNPCKDLPSYADLRDALKLATDSDADGTPDGNGGFNLNMWGTVVNRDGVVCAVAFTGDVRGDQWPGSRAISAQKANTGNAFSLAALALSTANLYSAVSPGGSLYGLQHSNPVSTTVAYHGNPKHYGQANDPMVGRKIGGVNVFGGGGGLYNAAGTLVGGLGVSGDSSCADHNIFWKTRFNLNLDNVPGGVSTTGDDNIVNDITSQTGQQEGVSADGWGHPVCSAAATTIGADLPTDFPVGP